MESNQPDPGCEPGAFSRRATRPIAEAEGVEPSKRGLEPRGSPRSTPLFAIAQVTGATTSPPRIHAKWRVSESNRRRLFSRQLHHPMRVCKPMSWGAIAVRPVGIEPTPPPWESGTLPLHHGRKIGTVQVVMALERTGFEPAVPA